MFEFKILESGRVKCPKCDASCARRDLTFRHLRAMHKLNPDGTPCDSRVVTGNKQKKRSCDTLEVPAPTTTTFTRHVEDLSHCSSSLSQTGASHIPSLFSPPSIAEDYGDREVRRRIREEVARHFQGLEETITRAILTHPPEDTISTAATAVFAADQVMESTETIVASNENVMDIEKQPSQSSISLSDKKTEQTQVSPAANITTPVPLMALKFNIPKRPANREEQNQEYEFTRLRDERDRLQVEIKVRCQRLKEAHRENAKVISEKLTLEKELLEAKTKVSILLTTEKEQADKLKLAQEKENRLQAQRLEMKQAKQKIALLEEAKSQKKEIDRLRELVDKYKPTVRARLGRDATARQVEELRQEAHTSTAAAVKRRLEISDQPMTTKRQPTGREIAAAKEINCVHQEDDLSEDDQPTVE